MAETEGYNGAFTGQQIDEAIGLIRNKNYPADGVKFSDGETFQQKYNSGELKGPKGDSPELGVDYWTEADKEEITQRVIDALPVYNGEVE